MRLRLLHPVALVALIAFGGSTAALADTDYDAMLAEARHDCIKAAPAYPAGDQAPPKEARCVAANAYYGIGEPVDDAKARACAYAAHDVDVLAMLYANGRGVKRNIGVARRAVCDDEGAAPAEIDGRLKHLARLETAPDGKPFDWCDDVTSGLMEGMCASLSATLAQQRREGDIARRTASWTPAQKAALATLTREMEVFVKARDGEVDLGGTARGAMLAAAEDEVRQQFAELLASAIDGHLAAASRARAKAADDRLNAAWKTVRAVPGGDLGTVQQPDLLKVQRAWLRYRDAWVTFGKARFPEITPDTWIATLTDARVTQLKALAGDTP